MLAYWGCDIPGDGAFACLTCSCRRSAGWSRPCADSRRARQVENIGKYLESRQTAQTHEQTCLSSSLLRSHLICLHLTTGSARVSVAQLKITGIALAVKPLRESVSCTFARLETLPMGERVWLLPMLGGPLHAPATQSQSRSQC